MKIRINYVSNSSSSSFICDVCGNKEVGYDAMPRDVNMIQCENGHIFCECHANKFEHTVETFKDYLKRNVNFNYMMDENVEKFKIFFNTKYNNVDEMYEQMDGVIESYYNDNISDYGEDYHLCPICSFNAIKEKDAYKYLLKTFNINEQELLNEMKNKFKEYPNLVEFLQK